VLAVAVVVVFNPLIESQVALAVAALAVLSNQREQTEK
jgi:hypothetical protein